MEPLVTIRTFTYAHEAEMAKSLLQSAGIYCFLKDSLTIQANPFLSNALGGVKLQVRESDYSAALPLLEDMAVTESGAGEPIILRNHPGDLEACPACGSEELSLTSRPSRKLFGLGFLLLGFPIPFFSKVYHCYGCGRDIKLTRE